MIKKCGRHTGDDCKFCGGTGYRAECKSAECIEYGCSGRGGCYATERDYINQSKVKSKVKKIAL